MTTPRQRPRTCVACREESPKRALVRVVRSPAGNVVLDERGKLPGRGAYLCVSLECIEKARKNKSLSRALKTDVGAEVYDQLAEYAAGARARECEKNEVQKELRLLLGLARRASLLHIGVDGVKSHSGGESLLILTAVDCSESVKNEAGYQARDRRHVHLDAPLDIEALSLAIGADSVQVIALPARSGLADKIKMLIFAQQRSHFSMEGRVALEQNESVRAG